jgi:phosphomevalonate kinase
VRVIAPGKLVLTGAYAVLAGAPAIVAAVDRYAIADRGSAAVDVRALHDENGRKLGLGSSAASVVASLGSKAVARGEDPRASGVRAQIFRAARAAHAREQSGGSGVDIAASVFGGVLRYAVGSNAPAIAPVDLPGEIVLVAYWSGTSARTSDLRERVDAFRAKKSQSSVFGRLCELAESAAASLGAGEGRGFIGLAAAFGAALDTLGQAADAPIVLPAFAELASLAQGEDAAFLPSGAGGGDVAVWLGTAPPSPAFDRRARALSMRPLTLSIDRGGVRPESLS